MANENTSAITRTVQLGPETTAGTAVAATKKLSSIDIMGSIQSDITSFRAAGSKFATVHSLGKEWSEWEVSSEAPCFDEMQYLLSSLVSNPTATTSDTTAKTWVYAPTPGAEDARKTFTIEEGHEFGVTDVAHKAAYGIGTSLTLDIDRDGTKLGGSMLARAMASANLTSSVATLPTVPILPSDWAVYLDTTSAGLGTTRLARVLGVKIAIEDVLGPLWTVDDSQASWVTHVETAPKCTVELTMQAEATAMGLLAVAQAGSTRYLRVKNTSSTLAGATTVPYSLQFDIAGQISEIGEFGDDQEVYTIGWTFEMTNDPSWGSGKPYEITLVNKQGAL